MICKNCGYILDKKDDVCQGCGTPSAVKHAGKVAPVEDVHTPEKKKVVHK